ncbi:MAG: hypothetical protein QM608_06815 [Caulobacter sp.]
MEFFKRLFRPTAVAREASDGGAYRIFTTAFDREIEASKLDEVLGKASPADVAVLEQARHELETGLLPWRTRLLIAAGEASVRVRANPAGGFDDTALTLLIDQSGSMRGQKMLYAAATADLCQEFLGSLDVRVEVLGFTTSRWTGGRSREEWIRRGRPSHPGRLNDILHIVYRDADDRRIGLGSAAYPAMLRPDLPKENLDGEALLWAADRLRGRPERRKILVLLSDGAPVDDATLSVNTAYYLVDHLKEVSDQITAAGEIELRAIGVGHELWAGHAYDAKAENPVDLGAEMLALLERLLSAPPADA